MSHFGYYEGGYFHEKLRSAAVDAARGRYELTRRWGAVIDRIARFASAISLAEAGEAPVSFPVMASLADLRDVEAALKNVRELLEEYETVASMAVQKHLQTQGGIHGGSAKQE